MEACIQNVMEQCCVQAEHIIVDGGSTDGTVEIIQRYASQYSHIRWVSEKDWGQSDAMNKGIGMAKAPVISFLNVDDYYEPGTLNRVLALVSSVPEPSLLIGNCNIWRSDTELIRVSRPQHFSIIELLVHTREFPQNPSSYFYHKSLHNQIGLYNTDEHFNLDVEFIYNAVQYAHVFRYDEVWGNYRMLPGTKTHNLLTSGQYKQEYYAFVERYMQKQSLKVRVAYIIHKSVVSFAKKLRSYRATAVIIGKKLSSRVTNRS